MQQINDTNYIFLIILSCFLTFWYKQASKGLKQKATHRHNCKKKQKTEKKEHQ